MNWQQLIYFQKVARHEHLTKAAEDLFITSSALSRTISSLEEGKRNKQKLSDIIR